MSPTARLCLPKITFDRTVGSRALTANGLIESGEASMPRSPVRAKLPSAASAATSTVWGSSACYRRADRLLNLFATPFISQFFNYLKSEVLVRAQSAVRLDPPHQQVQVVGPQGSCRDIGAPTTSKWHGGRRGVRRRCRPH